MPRNSISVVQLYNDNREAHDAIWKQIDENNTNTANAVSDLNTCINNHVATISRAINKIQLDIQQIKGNYSNIKWMIGILVAAIAVGILARLLI